MKYLNLRRIKAERVALGLTQTEVAKRLGWNRGMYVKRENGSVAMGADELIAIIEIMGFTVRDMWIFFTDDVPKQERNHEQERNVG